MNYLDAAAAGVQHPQNVQGLTGVCVCVCAVRILLVNDAACIPIWCDDDPVGFVL